MKFRTLGVALLAGGGLALAALPASPAAAIDDEGPSGCFGPTGEGGVSSSVVMVGEPIYFSGCGFAPSTSVRVEVNGIYRDNASVDGDGLFGMNLTFSTAGVQTITAVGTAITGPGGPYPPVGPVLPAPVDPPPGDPGPPDVPAGPVSPAPVDPPPGDPGPPDVPGEPGLLDDFGGPVLPDAPPAATEPVAPGVAATDPAVPGVPGVPAAVTEPPVPTGLSVLDKDKGYEDWPVGVEGERIVTASVLVIGIGERGITGLPFDPALVGSWVGDWVRWGVGGFDKDRDRSCFGDGFDKDRGKVDGVRDDRFGEHRDGLAAPVAAPLADVRDDKAVRDDKDGWDDKAVRDDKDGWDDKDDRDDKDGRDRNGDCIIAGGVVGVGGVGGVGGAGAAGAAGGALPFTGVATGAMASIAVALLSGGVLLRVAARRRRLTGRMQG